MLAVLAGNDILLFGNNINWDAALPQKPHDALKSLVDEGIIEPERIRNPGAGSMLSIRHTAPRQGNRPTIKSGLAPGEKCLVTCPKAV